MKVILLCAGLGTRLKPITNNIPKCLIDIKGKPVIRHILNWLNTFPIKFKKCVNLHYSPLKVMEYLRFEKILYSPEIELMGTAGAIKKMDYWLHQNDFIVVNSDTITNVNLMEMIDIHKKGKYLATIFTHDDAIHNGGVFIFSPLVLRYIPINTLYSIHLELIPALMKVDPLKIHLYKSGAYYFDVGTFEGLTKAHDYYAKTTLSLPQL